MDDLAVFWQLAHDKMATLAIRNASEADSLRGEVLALQGKIALLESSLEDTSEALGDEILTLEKRCVILEAKAKRFEALFEELFWLAEASADGHDEINEETPDAYIKLLEGRLDAIRSEIKERVFERKGWQVNDGD